MCGHLNITNANCYLSTDKEMFRQNEMLRSPEIHLSLEIYDDHPSANIIKVKTIKEQLTKTTPCTNLTDLLQPCIT